MSGVDNVNNGSGTNNYQLLSFIKQKYDYSNTSIFFDNIGYGSDFDWSTYADIINNGGSAPAIQSGDNEETAKKKSFVQIIKEIFSQASVKTEADTDHNGTLSAKEIKDYISNNNVSGLDGDANNISLNDLESLLSSKSINLASTLAALDDDSAPTGPGGGGDNGGKVKTLVDQINELSETISTQTAALTSLSGSVAGAGGLTAENTSGNPKIQAALQAKNDAKTDYDDKLAKFDEANSKNNKELVESLRNLQEYTESLNTANEQKANANANLELSKTTLTTIQGNIKSVEGQISTLESSRVTVPTATADNQKEILAAESTNSQINAQINTLNEELAGLKTQEEKEIKTQEKLNTEIKDLDGQIGEATTAINTAQGTIDDLKSNMSEAELTALSVVTDAKSKYDKESANYLKVKSDEMAKQNKEIAKNSEKLADKTDKYRTDNTKNTLCQISENVKIFDQLNETQLKSVKDASLYVEGLKPEDRKNIEDKLGFSLDYLSSIAIDHPEIIEQLKNIKNIDELSKKTDDVNTAFDKFKGNKLTVPGADGSTLESDLAYFNAQKGSLSKDDTLFNIMLMYKIGQSTYQDQTPPGTILGGALNELSIMSEMTDKPTTDEFDKITSAHSYSNSIVITDAIADDCKVTKLVGLGASLENLKSNIDGQVDIAKNDVEALYRMNLSATDQDKVKEAQDKYDQLLEYQAAIDKLLEKPAGDPLLA